MRLVVTALAALCIVCAGSAAAKPRGGGSGHAAHSSSARPSTSSRMIRPHVKATPSQSRSSALRATSVSARHRSPSTHALRSNTKPASLHRRTSIKAQGVQRHADGRIARDPIQRATFERSHPCPSTGRSSGACAGYVVDHITPLKRGGADRPENMQWQTTAAAKLKDKTE